LEALWEFLQQQLHTFKTDHQKNQEVNPWCFTF
jgi:hypothetical protein